MNDSNTQAEDGRSLDASLSGAHFRAVTDSTRDAVVTADHEGRILFYNRAAANLFGYAPEEILGQPITILMPDRFRALHLAGLSRFKTTHEARMIGRTIQLFGLTRDGREFPIELSLSTWQDGGKTYFAGIIRDTTERKRAEMALRESERRYRQLFEDSPTAMFITTADGTIAAANQPALDMFGFTREEVVGLNVAARFVDPTDRTAFREATGTGSIKRFEVRLFRADRTILTILLTATRILDESGNSLGVQGILEEIAAERMADSTQPTASSPIAGTARHNQPDTPATQETPPDEFVPTRVHALAQDMLVDGHVYFEVASSDIIALLKFYNWIRSGGRATLLRMTGLPHGQTMLDVEMNDPMPFSTLVNSPLVAEVEQLPIDAGRVLGTSRVDHRYSLTLSGL